MSARTAAKDLAVAVVASMSAMAVTKARAEIVGLPLVPIIIKIASKMRARTVESTFCSAT
jgi:hypothetical protein